MAVEKEAQRLLLLFSKGLIPVSHRLYLLLLADGRRKRDWGWAVTPKDLYPGKTAGRAVGMVA